MHGFHRGRIRAAHIILLGQRKALAVRQAPQIARADAADHDDITADRDAKFGQQAFAQCADGHARGRLARAGPFQRQAQVTIAIFDGAGQVRVAGAGNGHRRDVSGPPALVVAVGDGQGNGRAGRLARGDAGRQADAVLFDLHAAARAIGHLASGQVAINRLQRQRQARRHSFQNRGQARAVGFARGQESQHDSPLDGVT